MNKAEYKALKAQIKTYVQGVKHVGMWNNQLEWWKRGDNGEYQIPFPCVLIEEPEDATGDAIGGGYQLFDPYIIKIHIIHEKLNEPDLNDEDLEMEENWDVKDFKQNVYKAIQYFHFGGISTMNRTGENPDNDHDNLYHFIQTYTSTRVDTATLLPQGGTDVDPPFTWDETIQIDDGIDP